MTDYHYIFQLASRTWKPAWKKTETPTSGGVDPRRRTAGAILPTTFGRAFLVTLCYMWVVLLVAAVIFVAIMAFGFALGG